MNWHDLLPLNLHHFSNKKKLFLIFFCWGIFLSLFQLILALIFIPYVFFAKNLYSLIRVAFSKINGSFIIQLAKNKKKINTWPKQEETSSRSVIGARGKLWIFPRESRFDFRCFPNLNPAFNHWWGKEQSKNKRDC